MTSVVCRGKTKKGNSCKNKIDCSKGEILCYLHREKIKDNKTKTNDVKEEKKVLIKMNDVKINTKEEKKVNRYIPARVRIRRSGDQIIQDCDVYMGRRWTMGGWDLPQSIWANKFKVKTYGREECIKKYEEDLEEKIKKDKTGMVNELKKLKGKRLGCFCELKNHCHVDVVIKYYKKYC
jgi:hypothetical protein